MLHDPVANAFIGQVPDGVPGPVPGRDRGRRAGRPRPQHPVRVPGREPDRAAVGRVGPGAALGLRRPAQRREPNVSSALEIVIRPTHLGRGLSHEMLAAMRAAVKAKGHSHPVRAGPPEREDRCHLPMTEYVEQPAGGRPAGGSLAARAREGRRHDRQGRTPVDGDRRLARGVAGMDRPAVRRLRRRDRPEGPGPRARATSLTTTPSTSNPTSGSATTSETPTSWGAHQLENLAASVA